MPQHTIEESQRRARSQQEQAWRTSEHLTGFLAWIQHRTAPNEPGYQPMGMYNIMQWLPPTLAEGGHHYTRQPERGMRAEVLEFHLNGVTVRVAQHELHVDTTPLAEGDRAEPRYQGTFISISLHKQPAERLPITQLFEMRLLVQNPNNQHGGNDRDHEWDPQHMYPRAALVSMTVPGAGITSWIMQAKLSFE